jgi:hypothetical protein
MRSDYEKVHHPNPLITPNPHNTLDFAYLIHLYDPIKNKWIRTLASNSLVMFS